jgi:hypothetical protein
LLEKGEETGNVHLDDARFESKQNETSTVVCEK